MQIRTYKYTGNVKVVLQGIGEVEPGDELQTNLVINHPDFVEVTEDKNSKEKDKKQKEK